MAELWLRQGDRSPSFKLIRVCFSPLCVSEAKSHVIDKSIAISDIKYRKNPTSDLHNLLRMQQSVSGGNTVTVTPW